MEEEIIKFRISTASGAGIGGKTRELLKIHKETLLNDAWCKDQKIAVYYKKIPLFVYFGVSAPKSWILEYCPEILESDKFIVPDGPESKEQRMLLSISVECPEYSEETLGSQKAPGLNLKIK